MPKCPHCGRDTEMCYFDPDTLVPRSDVEAAMEKYIGEVKVLMGLGAGDPPSVKCNSPSIGSE